MGAQAKLFAFLLLVWSSNAQLAHPRYVTPDQRSGMLGSLSSPEFANAALPQRVAVIDNGYYNPQRTLTSLSSLSSFNGMGNNFPQQPQPDQMFYGMYPGEPATNQVSTEPYQSQQQSVQMSRDSFPQTQNQEISNTNVNEPTGIYRPLSLNAEPEPKQNDNKEVLQNLHLEDLEKAPKRKTSLADQIDITKQERAFTIDQPTVKEAVSRQKIVKDPETTSSDVQNKTASKPKVMTPKAIVFKSGNTIYKSGRQSANYRFMGKSFIRSPVTTTKATPEPPTTRAEPTTTEEIKTTVPNSILGGYFTTVSPVAMWKESIATTKGVSVPISSNQNTPKANTDAQDKMHQIVNPTSGAVFVGDEKPIADIIVNHPEMSPSQRNQMFQRQQYQKAHWNNNQHHNSLSSSLSNMKFAQKSRRQQQPVVKPTEPPKKAHVVSATDKVADIIIGSSHKGSLSMNTEPLLPRPRHSKHVVDNSHRRFRQQNKDVHTPQPSREPIKDTVDFQNNGMGFGMGSLSGFQKTNSNNNQQAWLNDKQIANELRFGQQSTGNKVHQNNPNILNVHQQNEMGHRSRHQQRNNIPQTINSISMPRAPQHNNLPKTQNEANAQNNVFGQQQRRQKQNKPSTGNGNMMMNNQQQSNSNVGRNQQHRRRTNSHRNQHHQSNQQPLIQHQRQQHQPQQKPQQHLQHQQHQPQQKHQPQQNPQQHLQHQKHQPQQHQHQQQQYLQQQRQQQQHQNHHQQQQQMNKGMGGSLSNPRRFGGSQSTSSQGNNNNVAAQTHQRQHSMPTINAQPSAMPKHHNHMAQENHAHSHNQHSVISKPVEQGNVMKNILHGHSAEPANQQNMVSNVQQRYPPEVLNKQNQIQVQMPGVENVPYNIVNMPPSPAEYFHKTLEFIPEPTDVRSVQKLQHPNMLYQNNDMQKNRGTPGVEYNIRNENIEAVPYNVVNELPSGQRWKPKESNFISKQGLEPEPMGKSQNMYQVDTSLYGTQNQDFLQSNSLNQMTPKLNPQDIMETSFNIPKQILNNPNLQMLNIENPRQSEFSLASTNILDIKPIDGLSSDIVQISELKSNIPIIEIPINYSYYETTTVPMVDQKPDIHTTSSLAAQGFGLEQIFTKAPEIFQMANNQPVKYDIQQTFTKVPEMFQMPKSKHAKGFNVQQTFTKAPEIFQMESKSNACGYFVNPFNKNEYAMSESEAISGQYSSKCPAGLHFRVDRCRCDWPEAQPVSTSGSRLTSCHYVVNPANKNQYANSLQDAQAGKVLDCPATLHFNELTCQCDWPRP